MYKYFYFLSFHLLLFFYPFVCSGLWYRLLLLFLFFFILFFYFYPKRFDLFSSFSYWDEFLFLSFHLIPTFLIVVIITDFLLIDGLWFLIRSFLYTSLSLFFYPSLLSFLSSSHSHLSSFPSFLFNTTYPIPLPLSPTLMNNYLLLFLSSFATSSFLFYLFIPHQYPLSSSFTLFHLFLLFPPISSSLLQP